MTGADFSELTKKAPEKRLLRARRRSGGRNNTGRVMVRHIGGGHARRYRVVDFRRDKWNVPVHSRPLEDLGLHENAFDVVTLFYVIEHAINPPVLLAEVKRVLKPGGLVLLRWPHSTPIIRILGHFSRKLDLYHTPYHLYDFSPKTIEKLLVLIGFYKIQTMIGGYTSPSPRLARWASAAFGQLGEALYFLSCGNILLPGVSKTTLAVKKE